MSANRQYLRCAFKPGGKIYVYHNDGEPVMPGDECKVADARDETAWTRVFVISIQTEPPEYETKPILGRITTGATLG